ncbi:MAG: protein kinase [Anaerolineae bacterium]
MSTRDQNPVDPMTLESSTESSSVPPFIIGGRYQLVSRVGAGGMGEVFRANDLLTGQAVALKRLNLENMDLSFSLRTPQDESSVDLAREFETLASLRHPNIIAVLDYGFDEEQQPYLTMDLLEGAINIAEAARKLPLNERILLFIQLLQALHYLHRRGVIHRDLSTGNVLVEHGDIVKVLDFGLAVEIGSASIPAGTIAYMAPEVLGGESATIRSDLYAAGVIAYEMIAGQVLFPYEEVHLIDLINQIMDALPNLSLIPEFVATESPSRGESVTLDLSADTVESKLPSENANAFPHTAVSGAVTKDEVPLISPPTTAHRTVIPHTDRLQQPLTLRNIIGRLLSKNPLERYPDAASVIDDLYTVLGLVGVVEPESIRESFLQASRLCGREYELSTLTRALKAALEGRGSAWLLAGESGVGKSRLMNELRIRALKTGNLVLRSTSVEGSAAIFQLWRDIVRLLVLTVPLADSELGVLQAVVPDIATLLGRTSTEYFQLDGTAGLERIAETIIGLFKRHNSPIILLLDDIHWATESLIVLRHLSSLASSLPLLIIASYRDDERPKIPIELPEMYVLKLNRLTDEAVATLSEAMLGSIGRDEQIVSFLQKETEGNAFFLVEVVRALAEEAGGIAQIGNSTLPERIFLGGIQEIVQRRLRRVALTGRPLLELAAVIGREIDTHLLAALMPDSNIDRWLADCANAAVLEVYQNRWRFAHDKLREGVIAALTAEQKRQLHQRIAKAIEAVYTDNPDYTMALAYHWRYAEVENKERHYATLAGDQLDAVSLYTAAIEQFERALVLNPTPLQRIALTNKIGSANFWRGEFNEAYYNFTLSLELAEQAGDQVGIVRAKNGLGNIMLQRGEYSTALDQYQSVLPIAESIAETTAISIALAGISDALWRQGDVSAAMTFAQRDLTLSRSTNNLRQIGNALNMLGIIYAIRGDLEDSRRAFEESLAVARRTGDRSRIAQSLSNLGEIARTEGDYATAHVQLEEALQISEEIGNQYSIANVQFNLGLVSLHGGDLVQTKRHIIAALRTAYRITSIPLVLGSLAGLGYMLWLQQQPDRALELLGLAVNHPGSSADIRDVLAVSFLAEIREALGEEQVNAGLERGKTLDLEATVASILAQES